MSSIKKFPLAHLVSPCQKCFESSYVQRPWKLQYRPCLFLILSLEFFLYHSDFVFQCWLQFQPCARYMFFHQFHYCFPFLGRHRELFSYHLYLLNFTSPLLINHNIRKIGLIKVGFFLYFLFWFVVIIFIKKTIFCWFLQLVFSGLDKPFPDLQRWNWLT